MSNVDYLESELSRALDWLRNSPTSLASSINSSSNSSNALLIAQVAYMFIYFIKTEEYPFNYSLCERKQLVFILNCH